MSNNESASSPDPADDSADNPDPAPVYRQLLQGMKTLHLASIDGDGFPHCSYTPFLHQDNHFYVFISDLAAHTGYLLERGIAAVMIIADETDSAQLYARTRAYFQCDVQKVAKTTNGTDDDNYEHLMQMFEQRHGKTVRLLRTLSDFHLVRLTPRGGQFVMGFGQAYRLSGPSLEEFTHIRSA